jgi:hypothetical protein
MTRDLELAVAAVRRERPSKRLTPPVRLLHGVREHLRLHPPTPGRRAGALSAKAPRNRT